MTAQDFGLDLPDADATDRLARLMAGATGPGDTILLEGPIGAGKSQFARAFIRARLGEGEEVPSPTFTLVQTYGEGAEEIWHADLYRLAGPADAMELGLDEAMERALCLIEWPDRLGGLAPPGAIRVALALAGEGRRARIAFPGRPALAARLSGWRA